VRSYNEFNSDWIHVSELEVYIKSLFAVRSYSGCEQRNKVCLQSSSEFENESERVPLVIDFDLKTMQEMINIGAVKDWIYSLSFCKIESLRIEELNLENSFTYAPEYVEIKLSIWPCKLRV